MIFLVFLLLSHLQGVMSLESQPVAKQRKRDAVGNLRDLRSDARAPAWSNGLTTMLISSSALTAWARPATPPLMGLYF